MPASSHEWECGFRQSGFRTDLGPEVRSKRDRLRPRPRGVVLPRATCTPRAAARDRAARARDAPKAETAAATWRELQPLHSIEYPLLKFSTV
eukprot:COSAG02_NODE_856_length_16468_cov_131.787831_6_plen_92_part_00